MQGMYIKIRFLIFLLLLSYLQEIFRCFFQHNTLLKCIIYLNSIHTPILIGVFFTKNSSFLEK